MEKPNYYAVIPADVRYNKGKPTMSKLDYQINAWQEAKKLL